MSLHLRAASAEDAKAIAQVKNSLWPEEATSPNYIAQVTQQPDHHTLVALAKGRVVGFVDGFITLGPSGQRRWEVDLLGVHPAHQGRGIGLQLVQATTAVGRELGARLARGLVAVQNGSSQKVFARAGYDVEKRPLNLWVSSMANGQLPMINDQLPATSYLIPVITLNYRGLWLEGELSATSLVAAQAICVRMGWNIAGVLIPISAVSLNEAAHETNYAFINQFQFWQRVLTDISW